MSNLKNRLKKHYAPMLLLSIIFSYVFHLLSVRDFRIIAFITYISGYISIFFLAVSLILGPINLIVRRKNPVSTYIRRDIGIFGGILGVVHSVVGFFMHFTGKPWMYFVKEVEEGYAIRFGNFGLANYTGLFAALIIILLLAISNNYSLRKLKAIKWKNLQRFTYFMFVLVIAHSIFYRLNANKEDLILYLYLPMFLLVLIFQIIGVFLNRKKQRHTSKI